MAENLISIAYKLSSVFGSLKDRQGLEISCDVRAQPSSEWLSEDGNGLCSSL